MTDTSAVVRTLNAAFQGGKYKHGLQTLGSAAFAEFCGEMVATFEAAERDPAAFLASHAPRSRGGGEQHVQAQPTRQPSSAEGSGDHGWAAAFAKASSMPRQ